MILTIIPDIVSGVSCFKRVVSPYVALSELFYSCMSIVKNTQHTLNITKLRELVILMILLTQGRHHHPNLSLAIKKQTINFPMVLCSLGVSSKDQMVKRRTYVTL